MEKYLADRLYALIYRMCQVQAFSSRLHARGFPAIGKYEPKTPPRTAGVTKCVIGFGRYSGFVRHFCREGPILRNPETGRTSFPRSRTRGRCALAPASFPFLSPGGVVRLRTDNTMPGEFVLLLLSRFSARCRNCSPPGAFIGNRALRIVRMPNRPGIPAPVRPVGQPACTRAAASSIASGGILFR